MTRKDAPLLFDTRLQAKSAYWGVADPSKIGTSPSPSTSSGSASPSASVSASASASAGPSAGTASCAVTYRVTGSWPGGFQGEIKISNTGTAAYSGWSLHWQYTGGQRITQLWGGAHTQSDTVVTVTNASWNGGVPAGGSTTFGFLGSWTGGNPVPAAFTVNGSACTIL
ncbi:cellulose-binding domain-containing protein [Actinoplanes sp. NPDC049802]|uniref:cellulose-binding domain-containing protein n=1 Tax=Actinoplanes sp. NPDC049802 TaxID=3154742 RepID=UPI0033CEE157